MNLEYQTKVAKIKTDRDLKIQSETAAEPVLCQHCQRTATNGIKCKGICVADNDY
jgi:hypothetical protein